METQDIEENKENIEEEKDVSTEQNKYLRSSEKQGVKELK